MRNISRFIALFILLAAAFIIFGITKATLNKSDSGKEAKQSQPTKPLEKKAKKRKKRTYTVKSGDTLGSIASKFDITLTRLLELNPDIDPQSLQPGTKLSVPR